VHDDAPLPERLVALTEFRISSFCSWGDCVEVGLQSDGTVAVRDTKDPERVTLSFTAEEWSAFVAGVKNGEFDVAPGELVGAP